MRILKRLAIEEFFYNHKDSETALKDWFVKTKNAEWDSFSDVKNTFNSVDHIGKQHYVFNIKGNSYRLVAVIKFTIKTVYIRFIGTHAEYSKIDDCSTL